MLLPALLFLTLPLTTAGQEIMLAVLLTLTLAGRWRRHVPTAPLFPEALALATIWCVSALASGNLREGLGHAWLLAPFVALAPWPRDPRIVRVGVGAAVVAALWALGERLGGAVPRAGFSHHLSLAYALLPPLGVALSRRWYVAAALIAAGSLSTGSAAVPIALVTVGLALRWPLAATAIGVGATIAALGPAGGLISTDLHQRAVLWTGGLMVAGDGGVGAGDYARASALTYTQIEPGFWFPNHAHDSHVQALAVLGPAGFVAQLVLILAVLRRGGPAAAGLAGVVVGSFTQEVFGDLEVARAAWIWAAWLGTWNPSTVEEV